MLINFGREKIKRNQSGFIILSGLVLAAGFMLAPLTGLNAEVSPDAIAVRVMPNAEHYSPASWYKQNVKVQGAPQALIVDGYEAVRDGRTVYVNAANVAASVLYTNIYIISYNQDAEPGTIDIFGRILDHWKFNVNLGQTGQCSQSALLSCLNYDDCPAGEYCLSPKAKVTRDVKRLSDLAAIKSALAAYKNDNGAYPLLAAGSYLARNTLSVWPSWQENLAKLLSLTLPVDPVNRLGACPGGYDKATCWDAVNKKFAGTVNETQIILPALSHAYAYTANTSGSDFKLCAPAESDYLPPNICLSK